MHKGCNLLSMKIKLQTHRLYLREFTLADVALLYHMHQFPEVTRYTGDPLPWDSLAHTEKVLTEAILPQYKLGIGRWAVHLKETDEFIGWCGLKKLTNEYDLGYRYLPKFWGKGYGTEAAQAALAFGIKNHIQPIVGRAAKDSVASVKILQHIGLTLVEEYVDEESKMDSLKFIYKDVVR